MALTKVSRGLLSTSIVDNGNATAITIDSSENVGIGTSSPSRTFHSLGASGISTAGKFEAGGSQVYVQLSSNGQADGDSGYIGYDSSKNLTLFTDNTERLRVTSTGEVGIGTSSPSTLGTGITTLELKGNSASQTDRTGGIRFTRYDGTPGMYIYNADGASYIESRSTYPLLITTNGTERMRIDSSSPSLSLGKTTFNTAGQGLTLIGTPSNPQMYLNKSHSGAVNGLLFYHNNSYVGGLDYTNTATSLATSSDERLKSSIQDADDAGSKVDAIRVRQFDWKVDGSHQDYGFVAQELETVFDHAVHTAEDDMQTKGVDYASLVPMLVKEIQSLRARVAQLENT